MGAETKHFARTLLDGLITVWGVLTIVFLVSHALGDPAAHMLPLNATHEQIAQMRDMLGLNDPLPTRYVHFVFSVLRGEFGESYQFVRPALGVVLERLPASLLLAGSCLLFGTLLGLLLGSLSALSRNSFVRALAAIPVLMGQTMPIFWIGMLLVLGLAVHLRLLPTGGFDSGWGLVLPTLTGGLYVAANIARVMRSAVLETISADHVRTARAKGLTWTQIYIWHVVRNVTIPVVTLMGVLGAELIGGAVILEIVFSWPGVGSLIVQAIGAHDFPVVQAGVTLLALVVVSVNILTDVSYTFLDPRLRRRP